MLTILSLYGLIPDSQHVLVIGRDGGMRHCVKVAGFLVSRGY